MRIGDWGWRTLAVAPLNEQMVVKMVVPPDPTDVSWLYWSINVLIGATMLACLLLWLRPHWRDLERLKGTAERFGKGHLSERTQISPSSNIGSLAHVFDTMAGDIEKPAQPATRSAQRRVPRTAYATDAAGFRLGAGAVRRLAGYQPRTSARLGRAHSRTG